MCKKPNCYLPQALVNAFDAICPFCLTAPMIEELGSSHYMMACRNPNCSVAPEGNSFRDLLNAADDWRIRTIHATNTMRTLSITHEDVAQLPEATRYGIAEFFRLIDTGIKEL